MTAASFTQTTTIMVDAVLAYAKMPAETLAALSPNDRLEIEPQAGSALLVELVAQGQTLAVASVEQVDGQLIATIINIGPAIGGRRIDQWKHRKAKTTA